ncbi:hypothetical protein TL16_g06671 [Triparma laevis f. inornata]|uniref:Uncharacterized protein n=2 Tax=Triparma laevis TaxID=1534972 RepID=A0A9W7FCY7_9STRA|nr:hypothetical protein TL16_g06671 [Triparma laevis f. inornata]GMI09866.1 hypothetical protein TrLO_g15273 [Triparma laevis f. longispina]
MAFFGLTALGAQNPFSAATKESCLIQIFSSDEFKEGFDAVAKGESYVSPDKIKDILTHVYHGPAPEPELIMFQEKFGSDRTEPISWEEFNIAYEELVIKIENDEATLTGRMGPAASYNSYDELCKAKEKGIKLDKGPKENLTGPMTAVQEFGWLAHESVEKRTIHGKKSCAETVYASELVKSGVFY